MHITQLPFRSNTQNYDTQKRKVNNNFAGNPLTYVKQSSVSPKTGIIKMMFLTAIAHIGALSNPLHAQENKLINNITTSDSMSLVINKAKEDSINALNIIDRKSFKIYWNLLNPQKKQDFEYFENYIYKFYTKNKRLLDVSDKECFMHLEIMDPKMVLALTKSIQSNYKMTGKIIDRSTLTPRNENIYYRANIYIRSRNFDPKKRFTGNFPYNEENAKKYVKYMPKKEDKLFAKLAFEQIYNEILEEVKTKK